MSLKIAPFTSLLFVTALLVGGCSKSDSPAPALGGSVPDVLVPIVAHKTDESVVGNGGDDLALAFLVAMENYLSDRSPSLFGIGDRRGLMHWLAKDEIPVVSVFPFRSPGEYFWDSEAKRQVENGLGWLKDVEGHRCTERLVYDLPLRRWVLQIDEIFWRHELSASPQLRVIIGEPALRELGKLAHKMGKVGALPMDFPSDPVAAIISSKNFDSNRGWDNISDGDLLERVHQAVLLQLVPRLKSLPRSWFGRLEIQKLLAFIEDGPLDLQLVSHDPPSERAVRYRHANTGEPAEVLPSDRIKDGHQGYVQSRIVRDDRMGKFVCQTEKSVWQQYLEKDGSLSSNGVIYLFHEAIRLAYYRAIVSDPDDYYSNSRRLFSKRLY